jgi:hypothetical protein
MILTIESRNCLRHPTFRYTVRRQHILKSHRQVKQKSAAALQRLTALLISVGDFSARPY